MQNDSGEKLVIKIKRLHPDSKIPQYAKPGDAGMDLTAVSKTTDQYGNICYATGLAFEIPEGYFMMLVPRSSNASKDLILTNHCGIVDSGYRGEIFFKYGIYRESGIEKDVMRLDPIDKTYSQSYKVGDRIGQLIIMPYPQVSFEEVDELSESERGDGGYGSTGN